MLFLTFSRPIPHEERDFELIDLDIPSEVAALQQPLYIERFAKYAVV